MGFFKKAFSGVKKLFKKKKGGTVVGNLIRKATGKSTKNVNVKPAKYDPLNPYSVALNGGYGSAQDANETWEQVEEFLDSDLGNALVKTADQHITKPLVRKGVRLIQQDKNIAPVVETFTAEYAKTWFAKNWLFIVIPGGLLIGLLVYLGRRTKTKR